MASSGQQTSSFASGLHEEILHSLPFAAAIVLVEGADILLKTANERMLVTLSLPRASVGRRLTEALDGGHAEQIKNVATQAAAAQAPIRLRGYDDLASFDVVASPVGLGGTHALVLLEPIFQRHLLEPGRLALFEQLGPLSRGLVYVYDPSRRVHRYLQGDLAQEMGLPPGQIFDAELYSVSHPDDIPDLKRHFTALSDLSDRDIAAVTFRIRTEDAAGWIWMHARSRVLSRKPDGAPRRIIGLACDVTEERRIADQLSKVSAAIGQAEEAERRRIGRELHDSISPLLLGIGFGLGQLERSAGVDAAPRALLAELRATLGTVQREVRNISYVLHAPALQTAGLAQAIGEFAMGFGRRTGLEITTDLADPRPAPEPVAIALFRVVQEALMNTFRHAGARRAHVRLRDVAQGLVLEVEDDGAGMALPVTDPGVGIAGMRARVELLGGELRLSNGERGFRVEAHIPLPQTS